MDGALSGLAKQRPLLSVGPILFINTELTFVDFGVIKTLDYDQLNSLIFIDHRPR